MESNLCDGIEFPRSVETTFVKIINAIYHEDHNNIVYVPVPRVAGVYYCDKCLVHSSLELREAPIKSYKIIGMNTCEC